MGKRWHGKESQVEVIEEESREIRKKKKKKSKKHKKFSVEDKNNSDGDSGVAEVEEWTRGDRGEGETREEAKLEREKDEIKKKRKAEKSHKKRKRIETGGGDRAAEAKSNMIGEDDDIETERVPYVYEVDDDDHCESPEEAYRDIDHILRQISILLRKTSATLRIYDPYHCKGSMIERLKKLGYEDVYNKNEDFYASIRNNKVPEYDVLVTNPPYSADHIEKLLKYVLGSDKPSLLLIPNYVYMKDYYSRILSYHKQIPPPVFIVPNKRYLYTTPYGRRQAKSARYTSPFPTFWFCFLGSKFRKNIVEMARQHVSSTCKFVFDSNLLPLEVCPDNDPRKKKARNNEKRKKNKKRKKRGGGDYPSP